MSEFRDVMSAGELPEGMMKRVTVDGREILIAHAEGRYYAADARCPHMGGDLSKGMLKGRIVVCPRHRSEFDLGDGHVVRWTDWSGLLQSVATLFRAPRPVKTHEVKVEGERIQVRVRE